MSAGELRESLQKGENSARGCNTNVASYVASMLTPSRHFKRAQRGWVTVPKLLTFTYNVFVGGNVLITRNPIKQVSLVRRPDEEVYLLLGYFFILLSIVCFSGCGFGNGT